MPQLRLVPYGPAATAALRDAIAAAKGADPLAPVTVAVPSNYAGLSLRRALGRDGLVNARFLVLPRVAELLGAPALAAQGRRPLTGPVRAESIRAALAEGAEVFRDVAAHAATERALEQTFRELRQSSPDALDAVATRSPRASEVVRQYRDARRRTEAYYAVEDLAEAAAAAVRASAPALRDVGHVVLHLPRRLSPAQRGLVEALAAAGRCTAVLGLTGDAQGDAPARSLAATLERALGPAEEQPPGEPPAATQIVAVTDAEEEVRTALRSISERLRAGTPLHRMAVLYPAAQPYALLADEQFRAAGVPHNGPAVRTLAQTLAGRTLLGLLRLHEADFRREAVLDWLSAAPVLERDGGHVAPAHRWDVLSRGAGVVRGAAQWRDRLGRHARLLGERLAALARKDERPAWESARLEADLRHTERLAAFTDELAQRAAPGGLASWAEFAAWARELLERYLGGEGRQAAWPPEETEAYRSVDGALEALANLDDVRPRTDE
ncbi:MAG: hypothetical protein HY723_01115, partial [Chloroflexi bacterium]|nr:hypothetical protein [Chloroflexota bacterium]